MSKKSKSIRVGELDYSTMIEGELLELFTLYNSLDHEMELDEVAEEIARRAAAGELSIFEGSPSPTVDNLPGWLKVWPFKLLWKQRPR